MSDDRLRNIYLSQNTSKRYLPCINAYFMDEMRDGILVAVADYQSFDGNLKRDVIDEE